MKRILVASDLSLGSANALARAIRLAARDGAEIRIVHAAVDDEERDARDVLHRKIASQARIMAEELVSRALQISVRISSAGPGHAIVRESELFDADLVVLGAHESVRFRDALFGTSGSYVVRHGDCPILVVQNESFEPYSKTLVAVEDEADMPKILASALALAPDTEVFAVHAFYPNLRQTLGGRTEIELQEAKRALELEKVLGACLAGRTTPAASATRHVIVETGEALEVIMKETEALTPDLLVMGTRRQSVFLNSNAVDALFWCTNDILIVPDRERVAAAPAVNA
jgi:nucleotide-binding universal stress UspA family protein